MNKEHQEKMLLKNNHRVLILGGGPAGSFFAIQLLRKAKTADKNISVTIVDKKIVHKSDTNSWRLKGCNFCAGVISPNLYNELIKNNIHLPKEIICEDFTHIWIHGLWKNFPLKVPYNQKLCSVFRSSLPSDRDIIPIGFDNFLLEKAVEEGTSLMVGTAVAIQYTNSRKPCVTIQSVSGDLSEVESDFVCISTGINSYGININENTFFSTYQSINPSFRPPQVRSTLVFELKPGRDYLKKHMDKELYLIVSGSKQLRIEHIALVPKGDYLTVALVGESIDKASFPEENKQIIQVFFSLPHVKNILPHLTFDNTTIACTCNPFMASTPSKAPFEDRISMIGDILGARLYRDGLYSAFVSAETLAETVVHKGMDKESLEHANNWVVKWLNRDNLYCRIVFGLIQMILKSGVLSRIFYQTFATEMKFKEMDTWPLGRVLWKIGSGTADYRNVFKELFSIQVFGSFLKGGFKTFRNVLTEKFFGLHWGDYGRYPTVIIKEKRPSIKRSIQAPLGIKLDDVPEMERMYAIKIRASSRAIFEELAKFGDTGAKFLRLRFLDVRRTFGFPNQVGSIIRYSLKMLPISLDFILVKSISDKSLLYEPQNHFTKRGKLLFDITPTKDGNNRLVVYTAFDYKRGKGMFERIWLKIFKHLFPDYSHDVVWNHAMCYIKAEAERGTRWQQQEQTDQ